MTPRHICGKIFQQRKEEVHIIDTLYNSMTAALKEQSNLLADYEKRLNSLPEGSLYIKQNKKSVTYYQVTHGTSNGKRTTKQTKISGNNKLIRELAEKRTIRKALSIYRSNIHVLKHALKKYKPADTSLSVSLPEHTPQAQYNNDPRYHKHSTVCGIMVRSKSEALLVNALWHYNIPFFYEERFPWNDSRGKPIYSDITIPLPQGELMIWEHFGMLDSESYCEDNMYRLNCYHMHGYSIGKNLIITSDDVNGNCQSDIFYHIIETYILPYFDQQPPP